MSDVTVLFEDSDFIIVHKPAGLLVHGMRSHENQETLVHWLLERYPDIRDVGDDPEMRPGIVHRLDRDTSGVLVIARRKSSFEYAKKLFQHHEIKKRYLALVVGVPKENSGIIDKPIRLVRGTVRHTVWGKGDTLVKEAKTKYSLIQVFGDEAGRSYALVAVEPLTGRTHQIRVHLNSIGHPIVGDKLYGGKTSVARGESLGLHRQFLHAETIEFTGPSGNRLRVSAALPPDLEQALRRLSPDTADPGSHS